MNLDTTSKILQIVLGENETTRPCAITAAYTDNGSGASVLGSAAALTSGTAPVTAVLAPAPLTTRTVTEVRVVNTDTVQHTITLQLNRSGIIRKMLREIVDAGGLFIYPPASVEGGPTPPPSEGAIYAPLVNGDLPGPTLISDPYGQCVMAQIR
jgi:hypothetical protein